MRRLSIVWHALFGLRGTIGGARHAVETGLLLSHCSDALNRTLVWTKFFCAREGLILCAGNFTTF